RPLQKLALPQPARDEEPADEVEFFRRERRPRTEVGAQALEGVLAPVHCATLRLFSSFWPRTSSMPSTSARGAQLSPGSSTTALASGLKPDGSGSTRYSFVLPSVVSRRPSARIDPPLTNGGCSSVFHLTLPSMLIATSPSLRSLTV